MTAGTRRTHSNAILLTLALAVALFACGGGGGGGGDDLPSPADDAARAGRIVLTEADLPGLVRDDEDDDEDDEDDPFRECLNDNQLIADLGEGPRSAEATFVGGEDEALLRASAVSLAESEGDAEDAFDELTQPSFVGCFEDAIRVGFEEELGDDADVANLSVSELPRDDLGDESVGYRATLDVVGETDSASFAFDYVFLRVDRALAALFSFDIDDTFDAGERSRLAGVLADRMEDEL